jgi:hypothetical protein
MLLVSFRQPRLWWLWPRLSPNGKEDGAGDGDNAAKNAEADSDPSRHGKPLDITLARRHVYWSPQG